MKQPSRRRFLKDMSMTAGSLALSAPAINVLAHCAPAENKSRKDKLGIALVGLGNYATHQLAPALQETKNCYLSGIVTGTPSKEPVWKAKYNIPGENVYNYQTFDNIAANPDIDIIYVVLPVFMHKEYTVRAAEAGKHVICEKPMAINVSECDEMIAACKKANRMLSIGYRLHFEPFTQEMMRLGQEKVFGKIKSLDASNGFTWGGGITWRLRKAEAGGGPLMDMGVYCIQGCRYTTGMEPLYVKVTGQEKKRPELFTEVEETLYWEMEFPDNIIATCKTSYNAGGNHLHAEAENGWFELSRAYRYGGMQGATSKGKMNFNSDVNQQALQIDDFARCIMNNKRTRVPGEMGKQDIKIIEAIYRSMENGKKEKV